ncbi:MAG: tRNA preQ1(34) S-adenosylmethionine ribosyltransferase-isomerase QueA [bacterium]|nr:tRNA preQ1(34) S-adenosylmethionine ribosyltransferase-isomerase QueA [bacterium]
MRVDDFDFELPNELIATAAAEPRDSARLLVYDRANGTTAHRRFADLTEYLRAGDLLVVNDTRVMPWRLRGKRATGGGCECLMLRRDGAVGEGFVKPSKKLAPGSVLTMEGGALTLTLRESLGGGRWRFDLAVSGDGVAGSDPVDAIGAALERCGRAPLPPYITRDGSEDVAADRERYQTVFAARDGAVAAPTAGLHFTPELLERLASQGVERATVTLHVGEGTFAPLRVDAVEEHRMHAEWYELPAATAAAIAATRARGGRVIAVGTTSCRTLETCGDEHGVVHAGRGESSLFLYPGKTFRAVDALITNFHLPQSTLLMLVGAFMGRERMLALYRDAVERGYRFYSFGDAMLLT